MVQSIDESVSGCPNHFTEDRISSFTSSHRASSSTCRETCNDSLPSIRGVFQNRGLSARATDIIMASWRDSTKKGYKTHIQRWIQYCCQRKIDKVSPSVNDVLEFLTYLFDKGLGYSSLNTACAALSSLGVKLENFTAGSHPLIVRFLKGVYNIRPTKARYSEIWDVDKVLNYIRRLSPVKHLSLKDLTLKLVMLLALTNAARIDTVHKLGVHNFKKTRSEFIFEFSSLLKQSRPGFECSNLRVKAYPPDRRLCCYFVMKEYLMRTKMLRRNEKCLLISYVKPHKAVSKDTVARWIKTVMCRAGIDINVFGPHSVRSAVTSKAQERAVPIKDIMQTAGWSRESTFAKFYKKKIIREDAFQNAVLQI